MRFSSRHHSRYTIPLPKGCGIAMGIMFALLGIALLAGGLAWWQHVNRFVQSAGHAEGTVVEINESRDRDGNFSYSPAIEYTDHQGQLHKHRSNIKSNPSMYSVGDKVEILYDKDRPDSAGIDSWFGLYFGPLLLTILGGGFFFVGTAVAVAMMYSKSSGKPTNDPMNDPMMQQPPGWNQ